MVRKVKALTKDWSYDVVSIGYPGPVINNRPLAEPHNLGRGWAGFNFEKAFGRPTKVVNDALMQAIGSYQGGRMLFLGVGTGLGSAMIVDGILGQWSWLTCRTATARRSSNGSAPPPSSGLAGRNGNALSMTS